MAESMTYKAGEKCKKENKAGTEERHRQTERKVVCVKDLEVEIENA